MFSLLGVGRQLLGEGTGDLPDGKPHLFLLNSQALLETKMFPEPGTALGQFGLGVVANLKMEMPIRRHSHLVSSSKMGKNTSGR